MSRFIINWLIFTVIYVPLAIAFYIWVPESNCGSFLCIGLDKDLVVLFSSLLYIFLALGLGVKEVLNLKIDFIRKIPVIVFELIWFILGIILIILYGYSI